MAISTANLKVFQLYRIGKYGQKCIITRARACSREQFDKFLKDRGFIIWNWSENRYTLGSGLFVEELGLLE